jgi:hypothetical protein
MEIIIASRMGTIGGKGTRVRRWEGRRNSGLRVVAKGAHSAYELGKMDHFLQLIDWSGLAGVVKERVEVRLSSGGYLA